jgi:hypothetical protein
MIAFVVGSISMVLIIQNYKHYYLWYYGLYWYPFILIAPSQTLLLGKFFDLIYKYGQLFISLFSLLGEASLEILLVSDYIFNKTNAKLMFQKVIISQRITAFCVIVVSVIIGVVYRKIMNLCSKFVTKLLRQEYVALVREP